MTDYISIFAHGVAVAKGLEEPWPAAEPEVIPDYDDWIISPEGMLAKSLLEETSEHILVHSRKALGGISSSIIFTKNGLVFSDNRDEVISVNATLDYIHRHSSGDGSVPIVKIEGQSSLVEYLRIMLWSLVEERDELVLRKKSEAA